MKPLAMAFVSGSMHALAFLAVATTIVVGGGEDAAATVADGGACGHGRVIPDDRTGA